MSAPHHKRIDSATDSEALAADKERPAPHLNGNGAAPKAKKGEPTEEQQSEALNRILSALAGLDYGSVEIIVQDYRIVQIERTQRSLFPKPLSIPQQDHLR